MRKGAPSVNPTGKAKPQPRMRTDEWENTASGHGTSRDRRTLTRYGTEIVTDLYAERLWRSQWLAAKCIEKRPEEMFRRGYEIKSAGADPKKLAKVATRAQELDVDGRFVFAEQLRYAKGGAAILGVFDGALGELSEPLDETKILNLTALHVFEPRELWPVKFYSDLSSPKFGQPQVYQLMPLTSGRSGFVQHVLVHESRLLIFQGIKVSRQTQPGQREGWGDSGLSRVHSALAGYGLTWGSAETVLADYNEGVLEMDGLDELLATAEGQEVVQRRLDTIAMSRSTLGMTAIGSKDKYTRLTASITGFADVLEQQAYVVAAACGYPVSILLGIIKGGLSTGDNDVRSWYADVENFRNAKTKPLLERALGWIMKSKDGPFGGTEPDVWSVEFRPLWQPSEKEQAETFKTYADADEKNIKSGVYSADDAAKSRYGGDGFGTKITIDFAAREEQKKINEERAEAMDAAALEAMGRGPSEAGDPADSSKPVERDRTEPES